MPVTQVVNLRMSWSEHYRFTVDWSLPGKGEGVVDEPPPIGGGEGPNAARLVAAAVSHCLSSSLIFCLEKSHVAVEGFTTEARAEITRNDRGRWRLSRVTVTLGPEIRPEAKEALERCKGMFEDYCIVTEAIRGGVPVDVRFA